MIRFEAFPSQSDSIPEEGTSAAVPPGAQPSELQSAEGIGPRGASLRASPSLPKPRTPHSATLFCVAPASPTTAMVMPSFLFQLH